MFTPSLFTIIQIPDRFVNIFTGKNFMRFPHIQSARPSTFLAGEYALQGRELPAEFYCVFLQASEFERNATYWLKRSSTEPLVKVNIESVDRVALPDFASTAALDIDSMSVQPCSFWVGNTAAAAVRIAQDATTNTRYKILISIA